MRGEKDFRFNAANERIKYKYRIHVKRIDRKDIKTVLEELKHIRGLEKFIDFADFKIFDYMIAERYINHLFEAEFSLSYIGDNVRILRDFLMWLKEQRGYKGKIKYNDIDYLGISNKHRRIAKAQKYRKSYKYEQILKTIRNMPEHTVIEKRNRAIISLQALCSLRIGELRTVKLRNLIQEDEAYFIDVNPKDMEIKFGKERKAIFIALPDDILNNVIKWRDYLITQTFEESAPLFPQISSRFNQYNLTDKNLMFDEIKSGTTVRNVFKKAFQDAGFEYINPHSFRRTLAKYAEHQPPAFMNAVRQSLGHSSIDTTFCSYGQLSEYEQRERISRTEITI